MNTAGGATTLNRPEGRDNPQLLYVSLGLWYRGVVRLASLTLLCALVVGIADAALAYVLPADFLMRMLADKRRALGAKDLSVTLTTDVAGFDAPIDERIYLKTPERLRDVRQEDEVNRVYVEREGQLALGPENALVRQPTGPRDLTAALLSPLGKDLDEMSARMLAAIAASGIDARVVALGRLNDSAAFIIGAKVWEADKPQLWLHKSSFLPMRQIFIGKDKVVRETRWLEWGASITGDYFPLIVETYENGKLTRRAEATKLALNQSLPETLFELPK
jgi:hypothetical protein